MPRRSRQFSSQYELSLPALPTIGDCQVDWDQVFGVSQPLRIEVGVGNSRFLIEVAKLAPAFSYLGFEYSHKRVVKFLKKVEAEGIANIRVLPVDISKVIDSAFQPKSIDHFYINHPDPWPKRRHARRRFISRENAVKMLRLLREGGGISLRTDVAEYAAQMLHVLDGTEGLLNLAGGKGFSMAPLVPFTTAYESRFLSEGRTIYYLEYRKESRDALRAVGELHRDP